MKATEAGPCPSSSAYDSLATLTELRRIGNNKEASIRWRTARLAFKIGKCHCCHVVPEELALGSNQCGYCVDNCDVFYHHARGTAKGQAALC